MSSVVAPAPRPHLRRALLVFARAPRRGQVKTRLAATMGDDEALRIYRSLAERVVGAVTTCDECDVTICCSPDDATAEVAEWIGGGAIAVVGQGDGDLGERMSRALAQAFGGGAEQVVIIGTDCPEVGASVVGDAFAALDTADVVFGPAADGGYYLVGARRLVPALFRDIPWSTPDTLAVSLARADAHHYQVSQLAVLADIDTEADWRSWMRRCAE